MPRQHRSACATCPFRRAALPGFLGGVTVEDFLEMANSEARMPCHRHFPNGVDYAAAQMPGTPEFSAPQCAGRAIHWRNRVKRARDPALLELPADHVAIFTWPDEFREHHRTERLVKGLVPSVDYGRSPGAPPRRELRSKRASVYVTQFGAFWHLDRSEWITLCRRAASGGGLALPEARQLKGVPAAFKRNREVSRGTRGAFFAQAGVMYVESLDWSPEDFANWLDEHANEREAQKESRRGLTVEVIHVAYEQSAQHVATISAETIHVLEALEQAYRGTQNVESSWVADRGQCGVVVAPTEAVFTRGGCRSTSVGDYARVLETDGRTSVWRCLSIGWRRFGAHETEDLVGPAAIDAAYGRERG